MSHELFGTYLYLKKNSHCLSEIHILLGISYLCLLGLVSLFYTIVLMDSQYKLKKKSR